ncbi:MAG: SUMF1/EgtB/PvdO family nonheme iron enzyme, partial [Clostridia bacterium]|nr:SUMF1/EgtB/PvdO family nonheme iron enzyme [Clostridia bacterium]
FYIGRYEVGTDTARFSSSDALTTPVVQRDKYPYNFVTCSQAQERASQLKVGNKTSSLMFGIQWDLVLKFMEEKGNLQDGTKVTQSMLNSDSGTWGNYSKVSFDVKRSQALYTTSPSTKTSWDTTSNYTKPDSAVLLTTGATDRNSVLGIYDLAGNVFEWTLEYNADTGYPCTWRGGSYENYTGYPASFRPVSYRNYSLTTTSYSVSGFRSALW